MKDASWLSLLKKPYRFYHIFSTPHTLLFEKADDERQKDRFDLFLTLLRFLLDFCLIFHAGWCIIGYVFIG